KDINKSLFAIVETNLCNGPIYFDCFPNLLLDCVEDKNIHRALTVYIQTKGPEMIKDSRNISVKYRVYYKAMPPTNHDPMAQNILEKDQTMIYQ
ncbi:hypothetical protein, partial [Heyndrickxia coagulans]|uniref:hypothetical protein n=1 Tax=Heyndrickxia coagulans TaxID=1398 RepID=UPI00214D2030